MFNMSHGVPFASLLYILLWTTVKAAPLSNENIEQCVPAWNQFSGADRISSTTHSSIRGNDGLIYLGGRDGLYRIGGGGVQSWSPDFTNLNAIPSGHIKGLAVDRQFLWIGTNSGIARLDTNNGYIERNESLNKQSGYSPVNALLVYDEYLFVGTARGGYVLKLADDILDISLAQQFENTNAITSILPIDGEVLAAGNDGLWHLSATNAPKKHDLDAENLRDMTQINNTLWLASTDTLYKKKVSDPNWVLYTRDTLKGLPDSDFTSLGRDSTDRLWIGAKKGLSRWSFTESHPVKCRRGIAGSDRDQDISIAHLSGELGNYMFLGSRGRGATFAPVSPPVRVITPGGHYDSGLPANAIWSHIIDQQGRFIAGTSRGLFIERQAQSGYFDPVAESLLGDLRIYNLSEMSDGSLWIGTAKGLFIKRGDVVEVVPLIKNENNKIIHPSVFSIKVHSGDIFIATSRGLVVLNGKTLSLKALFKTKEQIHGYTKTRELLLPISRIWSMDFSAERVFIAGNEGALEVDVNNLSVVSSTYATRDQSTQPVGYIYNVIVVGENRLFLGTEAGLIETNFNFSQYRKISQINGRQLTSVMSSGRDSEGNIWIGVAKNGLFKYQPETDHWTHLTQSKGLITNGVSQLGLSFTDDGKMSVSNGTGASVVNLNLLQLGEALPFTVRAIDLVRNHLFEQSEDYKFGPAQHDLTLSFLVTELIEPALYSVEYALTSKNGTFRTATIPIDEDLLFVNLNHGAYHFTATVKSSSGAASSPIEFTFQILPHWWETLLFKLFVVIIMITLIAAWFYRKTKLIEQRLEIISDERKRVAQELHDTSLQDIFGAKMIGRVLAADLSDNQKDKAQRFLELIDRSISSLRESVGSLNNTSHISDISEAIAELKNCINLPEDTCLNISESGKAWKMKDCTRLFVYRIVREATNNAAKHAEADNINISLKWSKWALSISVTDDGKGFNVEQTLNSDTYGLKSIRSMAAATKIALNIGSEPEQGSSITIKASRILL